MDTKSELSFLAKRLVPGYYTEHGSKIVPLLQIFLDWLTFTGNPYHIFSNLAISRDIDKTTDEFFEFLKHETMIDFPPRTVQDNTDYALNMKNFLKNIVTFYRAKGSEASYKYFFRCLFNTFVKIKYPRENILKPSDGIWVNDYYIVIETRNLPEGFQYANCIGMRVQGLTSGAKAYIKDQENVWIQSINRQFNAFQVNNPNGVFQEGEEILLDYEFENVKVEYNFTIRYIIPGKGVWENQQGMLSDSFIVLQDSYKYQNYSYILTTGVQFNYYKDILKKLIHPAGLQVFGEFLLHEDGKNIMYVPEIVLLWHMFILRYFCGNYKFPDTTFWSRFVFPLCFGKTRTVEIIEDVYANPQMKIRMESHDQVLQWAMQSNKDGLLMFTPEGKYVPYTKIDWHRDKFISSTGYTGTSTDWHTIDIMPTNFVYSGIINERGILKPDNPEDYTGQDMWGFLDETGEKLWDFEINCNNTGKYWYFDKAKYANKKIYLYAVGSNEHFKTKSVWLKSPIQEELFHELTKENFAVFEDRYFTADFIYDASEGTLNFAHNLSRNFEIYMVVSETNVTRIASDGVNFSRQGDRSLHIL